MVSSSYMFICMRQPWSLLIFVIKEDNNLPIIYSVIIYNARINQNLDAWRTNADIQIILNICILV